MGKKKYETFTPKEHALYVGEVMKFRGAVINQCVYIERMVDEFISRHFCGKNKIKRNEIFTFVLATERITFGNKVGIFKLILEKYHKDFILKNKSLLKDINTYAIDQRNILAHYLLDTSDDWHQRLKQKGEFCFIRYKVSNDYPEVTNICYTQSKIDEIQNKLIEIRGIVGELIK